NVSNICQPTSLVAVAPVYIQSIDSGSAEKATLIVPPSIFASVLLELLSSPCVDVLLQLTNIIKPIRLLRIKSDIPHLFIVNSSFLSEEYYDSSIFLKTCCQANGVYGPNK